MLSICYGIQTFIYRFLLIYPMVLQTINKGYLLTNNLVYDISLYSCFYGGCFFWSKPRNNKPKGSKNKKVKI